jgi:hypothetical protein
MKHGDWAWVTIAAGVITYEATCPPGQLLSQAVTQLFSHRLIFQRSANDASVKTTY